MTPSSVFRSLIAGAVVLALAAACDSDEPNAPELVPTEDLTFLRLADNAPDLETTTASFWAVKGQDRRVEIDFAAPLNAPDTAEFLKFRVRENSLANYPDGRPFVGDDSVFITVTVESVDSMIVRFAPAGLRFSSSEPARLDLYYSQADHDFDGDGSVDEDDTLIETNFLAIWKQDVPGGPWIRIGGIRSIEIDEIEANITSFTGYAIAFRR